MNKLGAWLLACFITFLPCATVYASDNLIEDPSFELLKTPDQFGTPFVKWKGWQFEGDTEFKVGLVAHSGKSSALLVGKSSPRIRIWQEQELNPGRYRVTAFLRGLDISTGEWNQTTEFMFNNQYIGLDKKGTFGWSKLTFVGEVKEKAKVSVSFGLMAPGYLWIDDVTLEKVDDNTPLTPTPIIATEESPIAPPGALGSEPVRCPFCDYKNRPEWKTCYACGTPLKSEEISIPKSLIKPLATFEDNNPFYGGSLVTSPQFEGKKVLRIEEPLVSLEGNQDWSGYDYLKMELYSETTVPSEIGITITDDATQDYWTRFNYASVIPPGKSTLVLPLKHLYVGEKSRPGRLLKLNAITKFILSIGENPKAPLLIGKVWLERDDSAKKVRFDGLYAFDFGTGSSPVMEGFTPITPATTYSLGRGYGLKNASIWRAFDALQPDPLYQDFICFKSGGFAVDVPNGKYRVFINIDNPSGYWGEYQIYRDRAIYAQGKEVLKESMDFNQFKTKYFRFWNVEDLPGDNTFDKYQKTYFQEKTFDVEVTNGQLVLDFKGEVFDVSVSAIIIYPLAKEAQGAQFLKWVEDKRRFYFDNYFKRVLHASTGDPLNPTAVEKAQGYILFHRDLMKDLYYNDTPFKNEIGNPIKADSFPGLIEPITLSVLPLQDLGQVKVQVSPLVGAGGTIPVSAIELGYVSYRIARVTSEGSIYTIIPRLIMPNNTLTMPKDLARRFWMNVSIPPETKPGLYQGKITITPEKGKTTSVPIALRVRKGEIAPVDIPVGPFGYTIDLPWYEDDKDALAFNQEMSLKSLLKMRDYGFTMFSGIPTIQYSVSDGKQSIDYQNADAQMQLAKNLGFLAVNSYGAGLKGLDPYYQDTEQMKNAGLSNYSAFIKTIYDAIQKHAYEHHWLPIYWNLADEPAGDDVVRSIENAKAYKDAFPKGPPFFTGATSFIGTNQSDPAFKLSTTLPIVTLNAHDEEAVTLIREKGSDWAYYNGGNRWTFGEYLYKAAKQFDMKFRLDWHWNVSAGDPYYSLDSRAEDFAWFHAAPDATLISEVNFQRIAMGLVDYRLLLTLQKLAKEHKGSAAAVAAEAILAKRMSAFKLGQFDHDKLYPIEDWSTLRQELGDAIEAFKQ